MMVTMVMVMVRATVVMVNTMRLCIHGDVDAYTMIMIVAMVVIVMMMMVAAMFMTAINVDEFSDAYDDILRRRRRRLQWHERRCCDYSVTMTMATLIIMMATVMMMTVLMMIMYGDKVDAYTMLLYDERTHMHMPLW